MHSHINAHSYAHVHRHVHIPRCVSTDGGQGHALGGCVKQMHVVDLGMHRQKYGTEKQARSPIETDFRKRLPQKYRD